MPGLITNPQKIVLRVTEFEIPEVAEYFIYPGSSKPLGKVRDPVPHLSYVKITVAMERIAGWCK
jgi:hypothetical protein